MKKKPAKKEPKEKKLTIKEQLFVREYLKDFNASRAYRDAGYKAKSTRQSAYKLLTYNYIQEKIKDQVEARYKKLEMDGDRVLLELDRIGNSNIQDLFDDKNCIKNIKDIPEDLARAISSIEVSEIWEWEDGERTQVGEKIKVKFWDKPKGLELKGKYHKLFTERLEVGGVDELANELRLARERVKKNA